MKNDLHTLKQDGFVVCQNIISQQKIAHMLASFKKTFSDQLKHIGEKPKADDLLPLMQHLFQKDIDRYKRTLGALRRKYDVSNFLTSPEIIALLKQTMGWKDFFLPGGNVVHIMSESLKIPGGYFGVHPHQDFPSVQGSLDGLVIWIPLTDVGPENFSLEVIPKSHLNGILPTNQNNSDTWEIDNTLYNNTDFHTVEAKAGDIVLMTNFTAHRSSKTGQANRYRIALSTRVDNADESTFIERCYPSAYIREVHREQYFPNFPTVTDVKKTWSL